MIVSCPSCETTFAIPDEAYAPGRKARCSNCAHVFSLPELKEELVQEQAPPAFTPQEPPESPDGQTELPPYVDEVMGMTEEELELPARPKSKGKLIALALAGLICLGGLGYGGYFIYKLWRSDDVSAAKSPDAAQQELVKNLALANVRQYMITNNERVGRMAVVEGKVINNFTTPKELIRVEVTLYDSKGAVLSARQQYAGVTLSLFQLQVLSKDELCKALDNRIEILTNNVNIQPGAEVPFMAVFFDPPQGALEFGVKIIDVKDPPAPAKK